MLLGHHTGELASPIGGRGYTSQTRKDCWDGASNRFLRDAAIEAQSGSDLCDHVGGQKLHHNRDEIGGHGVLSILVVS